MNAAVVVMTKTPEPGKTKTRLMSVLSGEECALFHRACLRDVFNVILELVINRKIHGYVYLTGNGDMDIPPQFVIGKQSGHDLGRRLHNAARELLALHDRIIFVGSDLPDLEAEALLEACTWLNEADVVIGPALDGGYYLLGIKHLHDEMFSNIDWGGPLVLAQTLEAITQNDLCYRLLATRSDIDTWDDLKRFHATGDSRKKRLFAYSVAKTLLERHGRKISP